MSVRSEIISHFESVVKEQNHNLSPLCDGLLLMDSGLDSLCFAVIVARPEDELGFDPFSASEEIELPVTFSGFVKIFEAGAK